MMMIKANQKCTDWLSGLLRCIGQTSGETRNQISFFFSLYVHTWRLLYTHNIVRTLMVREKESSPSSSWSSWLFRAITLFSLRMLKKCRILWTHLSSVDIYGHIPFISLIYLVYITNALLFLPLCWYDKMMLLWRRRHHHYWRDRHSSLGTRLSLPVVLITIIITTASSHNNSKLPNRSVSYTHEYA